MHTSTITVVVLREPAPTDLVLEDRDLSWSTCRGSGAGGQHRNKTESAVIVKHAPSGLSVRCESERSQHQNKATALGLLRARLLAAREGAEMAALRADRQEQAGCGARGDKRRTIQYQNDSVVDHITGKRLTIREYERGELERLS